MTKTLSMMSVIYWVLISATIQADDATKLVKKLSLLETFSGQFHQRVLDEQQQLLQESNGDFSLKRPGYFLWKTQEPFPQLLVSNLKTIWLYDPDLEQVTVQPYQKDILQTPVLLLSGDVSKINTHYEVSELDAKRYRLVPRTAQQLFTDLLVVFEDKQLVQMVLNDSLGQSTQFSFTNGVYNQPIAKETFEFTPPEGTDIIVSD